MNGDIPSLKKLLLSTEVLAAINDYDASYELTALHRAAAKNRIGAVTLLLEHGADAHQLDDRGMTALDFAVRNGHHELADLLLRAGAPVNEAATASRNGNGRADNLHHVGCYPLDFAVRKGDPKMVSLLLEVGGADVNAANSLRNGSTALLDAIELGSREMVSLLLEQEEVDVNLADAKGLTPLLYALKGGKFQIISLVVAAGPDVNLADAAGLTPLHYAVRGGHFEMISQLVASGAKVGLADSTGSTPLHVAANFCNLRVVEMLVGNGADVGVYRPRQGKPPGTCALTGGVGRGGGRGGAASLQGDDGSLNRFFSRESACRSGADFGRL